MGVDLKRPGVETCHLENLSKEEITQYIHHRLAIAGCSDFTIFLEEVIHEICHFSGGTPRLINKICEAALLNGCLSNEKRITLPLIKEALYELYYDEIAKSPFQHEQACDTTISADTFADTKVKRFKHVMN